MAKRIHTATIYQSPDGTFSAVVDRAVPDYPEMREVILFTKSGLTQEEAHLKCAHWAYNHRTLLVVKPDVVVLRP